MFQQNMPWLRFGLPLLLLSPLPLPLLVPSAVLVLLPVPFLCRCPY